jgi:prolipoprotein diacylglyceryltransferase
MYLADPVVHHPFVIPLGPIPITGYGVAVAAAFFVGTCSIAQRMTVSSAHSPVRR